MNCQQYHKIRVYTNGVVGISYTRAVEGYSEDFQSWYISDIEGHPYSSMEMVCSSVFAKLQIPIEHKYMLLRALPRPGTNNPGMVAFYQDDEKRSQQKLTLIKPGRYLRKYLVDDNGNCLYSDTQIEKWANLWITEYSKMRFHLLSTAEDIKHGYTKSGINSCMSHSANQFACKPYHPCEIYGEAKNEKGEWVETDTRLAVIYSDDQGQEDFEPKPENIVARSIVLPKKLIRGPVYGDRLKLEMLLDSAGYSKNSDGFEGARMRLIETNDNIVCPYFDFGMGATPEGNHLVAGHNYDGGESQAGFLYSGSRCDECGDHVHEDDSYVDDDGVWFCENCYYERYTYCHVIDEHVLTDDMVEFKGAVNYHHMRLRSVSTYGLEILVDEGYVFVCSYSDDHYSESDFEKIETSDGEIYESSNFYGHMKGFFCAFTEEYYAGTEFTPVEVSPGVVVAKWDEAGYCRDDYIQWLEDNSYIDPDFEEELKARADQGELELEEG